MRFGCYDVINEVLHRKNRTWIDNYDGQLPLWQKITSGLISGGVGARPFRSDQFRCAQSFLAASVGSGVGDCRG